MEENKEQVEQTYNEQSKKKKKGLLIVIIVILVLCACLGGFLIGKVVYDKKEDKKNNNLNQEDKEEKEKQEKQEIVEEQEDPNAPVEEVRTEDANRIMNQFEKIRISDESLFKKDNFEISEISTKEMLHTAFEQLSFNTCYGSVHDEFIVTINGINEKINKYVKKSITIDQIKEAKGFVGQYSYEVIDNNKIEVSGCYEDNYNNKYTRTTIEKAEKKGNYVYIYQKIAFLRPNDTAETGKQEYHYYKNYNDKNKPTEIVYGGFDMNSVQDPKWNLYNTYKYTFKLIDGTYYFQSLELVK